MNIMNNLLSLFNKKTGKINSWKTSRHPSLYFPLVCSVSITIHLGEEIGRVIKMHCVSSAAITAHKNEKLVPLGQTLVTTLKLLAVSGLASFLVCAGLTSGLAFCNYYAGDSLKCLQSSASTSARILTRVLTNPVHFPLTTSTVIPVMLLLASNKSESRGVSRGAGWCLFVSLYSLFLVDLTLFSRTETYEEDADLVLPDPLHWRRPCGSMLRNVGILLVFSILL